MNIQKTQSDLLKLKIWLSSNHVSLNLRVLKNSFCPLEDRLLDFYFSLDYVYTGNTYKLIQLFKWKAQTVNWLYKGEGGRKGRSRCIRPGIKGYISFKIRLLWRLNWSENPAYCNHDKIERLLLRVTLRLSLFFYKQIKKNYNPSHVSLCFWRQMTPGGQPGTGVILNKTRLFAKLNTPLSLIMNTINVSVHQTRVFVVFYLQLVQKILNYLKTEKSTRKSNIYIILCIFSPCQFYRQFEAIN